MNGQQIGPADPIVFFGAVVEPDDGLHPLRDPHDDGEEDGVGLHHNAAGSQRDVRAVNGRCAVVGQGVVQDNLNQGNGHLVDAAADSHIEGAQTVPQIQNKALPGYADGLEMPQIPHRHKKGEELPQDGGQCGAEHPPFHPEDKHRVQDGVDDGARQHAKHGIPGASVRPNQVADAVGQDKKGHAQQHNPCVLLGVGQNLLGGAEHPQKGREEGLPDHKVEHARPGHQQNAVARQPGGLVRFPFAQVKGEPRGAADAQQQRNGQADGGERIGHIGGRIAQIPYPLANKNLVHNIIERANQRRRDAGNGKALQQFGNIFIRQWIFTHQIHPPIVQPLVLPQCSFRPGSACPETPPAPLR